jgi:CHAT domain-containing protein
MRVTLTTLALLMFYLWPGSETPTTVLSSAAAVADQDDKLTPERRQELEKKALGLTIECVQQYRRGNLVRAKELARDMLNISRTLYPSKEYPSGHPVLAGAIRLLGAMHRDCGEYDKASRLCREALRMCRTLYPKKDFPYGDPLLHVCINDLAWLCRTTGQYNESERLYREALDLQQGFYSKKDFPNGHRLLAATMGNLAGLHKAMGEYGKAEPLYRQALAMDRALYPKKVFPNGHPSLATCLNNLGLLLHTAGQCGKAEPYCREAVEMRRALYPKEKLPNGHPDLATSINNLALLYEDVGEIAKAVLLCREALEMRRALFPKKEFPRGHEHLASSIGHLAGLYRRMHEYDKAERLYCEALDMYRDLYPKKSFRDGHPSVVLSLNSLGRFYAVTKKYGRAKTLYNEALEMCHALYPKNNFPNGHPDVALLMNNLAMLHSEVGEYATAKGLYREALEMGRALYPKKHFRYGHPELIAIINNSAHLHHVAEAYREAEPLFREALDMESALTLRFVDIAAEAESWNYLANRPLIRDSLISTSRHLPDTGTVYDALWGTRAALTRVTEHRHRGLMASRDPDTATLADQLRLTRMSLAGVLLKPGRDADAHRKLVEQLTETKEDLEKRIAAKLKLAPLHPATASPKPKLLHAALPDDAVFVDLYRYFYFEQDPKVKGRKGEKRTPSYVAFVLRKDKPDIRVELKEAKPIDDAWAAWHKAITADRYDEKAERQAAKKFADLVWEPIRKQLPDKVKTVYLAPDGKLAQVPWGALPGKKADTVLLDEHAVCLVPHGPWLLERLEEKAEKQTGSTVVAYGGVDYDRDPAAVLKPHDDVRGPLLSEKRPIKWSDLPGTAREQAAILALAKKALKDAPIARSGRDANTKQLEEDLPKARYAHIATHGFFADPEFRSAIQVDPKLFDYRGFGERRGGARSPLVLSGLVLAGANRQGEEAAPDHGIITAEGLIGLRMEGLELAVLSACETGLGESGGGEGVYGLQRAFHVAGCKNVIASLWKVDDAATQALMTLFYRNLWEKKLDPAEALRQAQLTLYRNPAAVEVVKKRGADFTESDLPEVKPDARRKHAPTAHWAAFTFSGVQPAK